jgi:hypothetical protein
VALLIFSDIFLFLPNEFLLIISAAFVIPYVFSFSYGTYIGIKPQDGHSLTRDRLLSMITSWNIDVAYYLIVYRFIGSLAGFITIIIKKKMVVADLAQDNRLAELIPIPREGKEFDSFYTKQIKKLSEVVSRFSMLIMTLGLYVPLTLASYFFLKEEGLSINRVTMFGVFMIIFGLINYYSTRPIANRDRGSKQRFGLSVEEKNRIINPLLKSSFFIGIFLIPVMFIWAGFFQLELTLTYIILFAGLSSLSVLAREKITIKGNLSLELMESSGTDFQTYVPRVMVSGSLTMALVVYPLLKWYELSGALKALTSIPAVLLTIATGAFYASFIGLLVMIILAQNMSDRGYQGSRDSLAKNSLLYLYVFISLTFFGTFLIGITPSSIIVHHYNPNIFNIAVIFASGAIFYLGAIEIPYRLGVKRERDKNLQKQIEELKSVERQLDDAFSKKSYSDFTLLLFYQRERLKSHINELDKTSISLFRKLPLPAAAAAFLSGILMEIAVPRITEVMQGILRP